MREMEGAIDFLCWVSLRAHVVCVRGVFATMYNHPMAEKRAIEKLATMSIASARCINFFEASVPQKVVHAVR